jgi:hypothetical protein
MTSISRLILIAACSAGILSSTFAANVGKNKPSRKEVEQILEEIGGDHFPEKMKVSPIGPVETDSTYYHVFYGTLKKSGYHLIIFDNEKTYLGYYLITLEPTGYGEGEIYLKLTSDSTIAVQIPDEGPLEKFNISELAQQATFVRAPVKEEPEEEEIVTSTDNTPAKVKKVPEYRPWNITKDNKVRHVPSAIFVEIKDKDITIRNAKNGQVATFPISAFSAEDRAYLKDLLQ